jgi:hypothetical protein
MIAAEGWPRSVASSQPVVAATAPRPTTGSPGDRGATGSESQGRCLGADGSRASVAVDRRGAAGAARYGARPCPCSFWRAVVSLRPGRNVIRELSVRRCKPPAEGRPTDSARRDQSLQDSRGDPGIKMPEVCISVNASASEGLRGEAGPYASSPASHAGYITSADGT